MKTLTQKTKIVSSVLVILLSNTSGHKQCSIGYDCVLLESCTGLEKPLQGASAFKLTWILKTLHCGFHNYDPERSRNWLFAFLVCCPPEFTDRAKIFLHPPKLLPTQVADPISLLPTRKICGYKNDDRIVVGEQTLLDEHPWTALIRYDKPLGWSFNCGGALISQRYVLTAAHCIGGAIAMNWTLTQVRLGEWNISSAIDCQDFDCANPVEDVPIEEVIPHEGYNTKDINQFNDIALLRLSRDVRYSDFVKPICLPLTDELKIEKFEQFDMEIAGWGQTETRNQSDVKLKAHVAVVSNIQCGLVYGKAKVSRQIRDSQICAGGVGGRDSCRGDSGGALMCGLKNWVVTGVISYGPLPCGVKGWPAVHTRVGAYVDWILSKLRP